MNSRQIIQTLALLLFLVILPLGSWYYLKRGADYRIDMIKDLGEYAQLDSLAIREQLNGDWPPEEWAGKVGVWVFLPENHELQSSYSHYLGELSEQFEEKGKEVVFYLIPHEPGLPREKTLEKAGLPNRADQVFIYDSPISWLEFTRSFQFPSDFEDADSNPYLALTDSLTVRRFYDVRNPEEMARLVEHIVFLTPATPDITELKREQEK